VSVPFTRYPEPTYRWKKIAALRSATVKLISPAVAGDINWLKVSCQFLVSESEAHHLAIHGYPPSQRQTGLHSSPRLQYNLRSLQGKDRGILEHFPSPNLGYRVCYDCVFSFFGQGVRADRVEF
jgi:hypothetical protein